MKFQLFGRLRDDGETQSSSTGMSSNLGSEESGFENDGMQMGGSLDRTINNMFSQGYSQEEIKQELAGQYEERRIDDAINNAVANSASGNNMSEEPQPMSPYQGNDMDNSMDAQASMNNGFDNQSGQEDVMDSQDDLGGSNVGGQPEPQQQPVRNNSGRVDQATEELVETIVAENLDQLEREFTNIYDEIDQLRKEMDEIDQRIHDLEVNDKDEQEYIQKVDEMQESIDSYQSRIGGLEKAFQEVLPSLVENVRDITALVHEIKSEKNIETDKDVSEEDISDIDIDEW